MFGNGGRLYLPASLKEKDVACATISNVQPHQLRLSANRLAGTPQAFADCHERVCMNEFSDQRLLRICVATDRLSDL